MRLWVLALVATVAACGSDDGDDLAAPVSGKGGAGAGGAQGGAGAGGVQAGAGGVASGGAGQGGSAGAAPICTPGVSVACVGPGACQGGQVCNLDGSGFGACDCGEAGKGGSGGAAGGAAGQGGAGAAGSGGGCVALTVEQACAAKQCGTAPNGCGGLVSCPACDPWLPCLPNGGGTFACQGTCTQADYSDIKDEIDRQLCEKYTESKVPPQHCDYPDTSKPDGCHGIHTDVFNKPADKILMCCSPNK